MAWPKLKQYLENSWYRWASQDRQTWYAAQFQYWENVNIRDMKNWVCLSGWSTDIEQTFTDPFSFFTYKWGLYAVDREWIVYDEEWEQVYDINESFTWYPHWIEFGDDMYIVWTEWVFKITSWWVISDETPTWFVWMNTCVLNYANTFLLVWDFNQVWRYDTTWTPPTKIREFESSYNVFSMTQDWNYLKIYTSNWISTKIHYAKWTFDVEDTWLIQTVSFVWLSVNYWCVCSDQWVDYAVFSFAPWELKLSKIQWYNKTDIKWTQTWDWQKVFTSNSPYITACDWVVFAATDEWIRTFTEYNGWLWWWCVEFREENEIYNVFRFWEKLYACISDWDTWYKMRYYDLSFHPATYQNNWFIIGRVFDGWCAWLFKKNDQATITYNMPENTRMELSYRYDRTSFWYDKSNFLPIKKLTDTTNCYDIVVPTTPWVNSWWLLLLEDGDLILLEDWNSIWLEDLMICPFNKAWNLLEYRFDLSTTDNTKTPILFEHSLTYYDYMRKYR